MVCHGSLLALIINYRSQHQFLTKTRVSIFWVNWLGKVMFCLMIGLLWSMETSIVTLLTIRMNTTPYNRTQTSSPCLILQQWRLLYDTLVKNCLIPNIYWLENQCPSIHCPHCYSPEQRMVPSISIVIQNRKLVLINAEFNTRHCKDLYNNISNSVGQQFERESP